MPMLIPYFRVQEIITDKFVGYLEIVVSNQFNVQTDFPLKVGDVELCPQGCVLGSDSICNIVMLAKEQISPQHLVMFFDKDYNSRSIFVMHLNSGTKTYKYLPEPLQPLRLYELKEHEELWFGAPLRSYELNFWEHDPDAPKEEERIVVDCEGGPSGSEPKDLKIDKGPVSSDKGKSVVNSSSGKGKSVGAATHHHGDSKNISEAGVGSCDKGVNSSNASLFLTRTIWWFLLLSWLVASFLEWQKMVDGFEDWTNWMNNRSGIGVPAPKSWEVRWDEEQEHLNHTDFLGRFWDIVLALSLWFSLHEYGIVYRLPVKDKSLMVKGLSCLVFAAVVFILKIVSVERKNFNADFLLRLLGLFLFIGPIVILVSFFTFLELRIGDIFVSLVAFLPTGWGPCADSTSLQADGEGARILGSVKALARGIKYIMGLPSVAILAWFPSVFEIKTRLSRGLEI